MSVRKNNFGPRIADPGRATRVIESTRQALAMQPPGAAFPGKHEVKTWRCRWCDLLNPVSKSKCKFCGDDRGIA